MQTFKEYLPTTLQNVSTKITYHYQQTKTATIEFFHGPEESLYFQALTEPQFCQFSSDCDEIDRFCRRTWRQLKKRELDLMTLKNQLQAIKSQISSLFYYQQQLAKLAQKIKQQPTLPNQFADIINEARVRQYDYLKKDQTASAHLFYDELFSHLIQLSGHAISNSRLLKLINFYQELIDPTLLQTITIITQNLCQQLEDYDQQDHQKLSLYYPNKLFNPTIFAINQAFNEFDEQPPTQKPITKKTPTNISSQTNSTQRLTHITQATISALQTSASFIRQHQKKIIAISAAAIGTYYNQELTMSNNAIGWANNQYYFTTFNQFTTSFTIAYTINSLTHKQDFITPVSLTVGLSSFLQPTTAEPATSFYTILQSVNVSMEAQSVCQKPDGGYAVAGYLSPQYGTTTYSNIFVSSYDNNGTVVWTKEMGNIVPGITVSDQAYGILCASDGSVLITGSTDLQGDGFGELFVARFLNTGQLNLKTIVGGSNIPIGSTHAPSNEKGYAIKEINNSGYVIVGTSNDYDGDGDAITRGATSIILLNIDSSFTLTSAKNIAYTTDTSRNTIPRSIQITSDNGYIITGDTTESGNSLATNPFLLKITSAGTVQWLKTIWGPSSNALSTGYFVTQNNDDSYIMAGAIARNILGEASFNTVSLVCKFASNGVKEWCNVVGDTNNNLKGKFVYPTSDNGFLLASSASGFDPLANTNDNTLLVKLNATGGLVQAILFDDLNEDIGRISAGSPTTDNGWIFTGSSFNFNRGTHRVFLAHFDSNLNISDCNTIRDVTQIITVSSISSAVLTSTPGEQTINPEIRFWNEDSQTRSETSLAQCQPPSTPTISSTLNTNNVNTTKTSSNFITSTIALSTQNPATSSTINNSANINPTNLSSSMQGTTNSLTTAPSSTTQIKTNSADTPTTTNSQNIPSPNPTDSTLAPISTPSMSLSNNPNTFFTMPTSTLTAPPTTPDNTRQNDNSSSNRSDDSGLSDDIIITAIISGTVVVGIGICAMLVIYIIKPRKEPNKQQPQQLDDPEKDSTIKSMKKLIKYKSRSGVPANPEESVTMPKISATMSPKINSDSDSESNSLSLTSSS